MTALITSYYQPNYTADFAVLGNFLARLKPNKIVSSDEGLNLLRNRVITKPKKANKLGETLQNIFRKKEKVSPKPYSLRVAALDDPTKRKLITTTNQKLRETPLVSKFTPTVTTSKNINPKAKSFSTLSEARKENVKNFRGQIQSTKRAREISNNFNPEVNTKLSNVTRGFNNQAKPNVSTLTNQKPVKTITLGRNVPRSNHLTEDWNKGRRSNRKVKQQYPFLTENFA